MQLFKYASLACGTAMLRTQSISFSNGMTFNDPTELSAAVDPEELVSPDGGLRRWSALNTYGICCLTRAPLNPIMWAHYGDNHRGMVIGIDSDKADFHNEETCVLPAQYGSIIYSNSKPVHAYRSSDALDVIQGSLERFQPNLLEALQRSFLHKSSEWAYEEEVRVVKAASTLTKAGATMGLSDHGNFTGRYFFSIPRDAITSIHFGIRYLTGNMPEDMLRIRSIIEWAPNAELFFSAFESTSWRMREIRFARAEVLQVASAYENSPYQIFAAPNY